MPSENPIRQLVKRAMTAAIPRSRFIVSGRRESGEACITFDDGPHPVHTPRLLDLLAEEKVAATFFVVGSQAAAHPDIVRRMREEGHAVGNHTYTHLEAGKVDARTYVREVRRTHRELEQLIGESPRLFRPPHGKVTLPVFASLWRDGHRVVLWNKDPKDFACGSSRELISWFNTHKPAAGDIILLHDTHGYALEALPGLIRRMKDDGVRFVTADACS